MIRFRSKVLGSVFFCLLGITQSAPAQSDPIATKFKEIDANSDGKISPEEFKKFPALAARFKGADKNGDGLTLDEVRAHLAGASPMPKDTPREPQTGTVSPPAADKIKEGPKVLAPNQAGIGRLVPDLTANTIDGKSLKLSELTTKNALVVAFTSTSCPICKKYGPSLTKLEETVNDMGLKILFVNPTATDKPEEIRAFIAANKLKAPYIHDAKGEFAKTIGASTTAEVFLLDAKRTVIYRGALDDQYGLGYSLNAPRQIYLKDAIAAHLAGRQPDPSATTAPGCALDLGDAKAMTVPNDYFGRISRVMMANCVECHRAGGVAPFSLEKHEDLLAHAGMIAKVVEKGTMPPWFAAPSKEGKTAWANDRTLAAQDKTDLLAWLKSDRPKGDPELAPVPRKFEDGWLIGKPDLELKFAKAVPVKATGVMPYQNVTVETKLTEDKWVKAIEVRPGAREVVHHVLVFVLPSGENGEGEDARGIGAEERMGFFGVYVPGNSLLSYPEGYAKKLPKGSRLRFQMHYTPNGTATTDQTSIGLNFADKPPRHEVKTVGLVNPRLSIPPGADNHPETASLKLPSAATILAFFPHMHLRGKAFRFEVTAPGGKSETVLDVPAYDFNWQLFYRLAEPLTLNTGTTIKATGWFDNSEKNPANPDPKKRVRWGPQTTDEMMLGYVEYIVPVPPTKK